MNGEYADMFEQEYDRCVHDFIENRLDDGSGYLDWLRTTHGRYVHKGYFSIDKHGRSVDSKVKRGSEDSDDISAYDLILKNKERLLSFDEPRGSSSAIPPSARVGTIPMCSRSAR